MPYSFDIHENEFLEEIFQEGLQEGQLRSSRAVLAELLEEKFGHSSMYKARIDDATLDQLRTWIKAAGKHDSIDRVFEV